MATVKIGSLTGTSGYGVVRRPTPQVSVVVPTRNRRRLLERALSSALGQCDIEVEVVVVDEGSTDETGEYLRHLSDPRVSVVTNETPLGVARARNAGVERARCPWVAFLDDDDVWSPHKLAVQVEVLEADGTAAWSYVGAVVIDEKLRIVAAERLGHAVELTDVLFAYNAIPGGGSGVVARTELVRSVGGFDPELRVVADWDLWIRLALTAPVRAIDRPLVGYLRHPEAMSRDVAMLRSELEHVAEKYRRARQARGVPFDWDRWLVWTALMLRRSGRRWEPAWIYASLSRGRKPELLAKAALAALWPGWVAIRDRRAVQQVDPEWLAEAELWLKPLREQSASLA
jgi:glycosyltransferase involved in cell wall biosynthesis